MARGFGNAGAARCRTAWHRWRRVEILPRTLQTWGVAEFCLQAMPHADSVHVPPASALPAARPECAFVLSVPQTAPDRASVVRAASCPFAAQSGPVRVASFPRRQNAGWRRVVQPKAAALRFAGAGARPDARSPWPLFWGTWPRWIQNREEKKTHPPPQAFWPCGERDWPLLHRAYGGKGGSIFLFFVC